MPAELAAVAVLGDVHGNLPALDAVLADLRGRPVDMIWDTGDLAGYMPFPRACVARARRHGFLSVRGNWEDALAGPADRRRHADIYKRVRAANRAWTRAALGRAARAWLLALPAGRTLALAGWEVRLAHTWPDAAGPAAAVIGGHTHVAVITRRRGRLFLNPGAVGRPADGDPRATYLILAATPRGLRARLRRVRYDLLPAARALRRTRQPEALTQMLLEACPLKEAVRRTATIIDGQGNYGGALHAAAALAARTGPDGEAHAWQVTRLALQLFDGLQALHGLGGRERFLLELGALMHDTGYLRGAARHHKHSRELILTARSLPLDPLARAVAGSIARYHRKAFPNASHAHFARLNPRWRRAVTVLGGILRLADACDYGHDRTVMRLACRTGAARVRVRIVTAVPAPLVLPRMRNKKDLIEHALGRRCDLKMAVDP